MASRYDKPSSIDEVVEAVLAQEQPERVLFFPIKHFSPACAYHLRRLILERRPVGVLIEGPEDATDLVEHIVAEGTRPPLTLFSYVLDKKNKYGMNGVLTHSEDVPARFRGWWPLTAHAPEYQAIVAGAQVGAQVEFIDLPLSGTIPFHHVRRRQSERVVRDRHLAESAWFEALQARTRVHSFSDFWEATFEVGGMSRTTEDFLRTLLTFAECTRKAADGDEALEHDGTLAREAHMAYRVRRFLKAHPAGEVVVVTGAFHTVALPWTRPKKGPTRKDRTLETFLTVHSYRALARLYHLNRRPGYAQAVWEAVEAGSARPFDAAAIKLLLRVMRRARDKGEVLATADAVAAAHAAMGLAELRGHAQVTLGDIKDASLMSYVKGDVNVRGVAVEAALDEVLTGEATGSVCEEVGQPPLLRDFYARCRSLRLDVTGADKTVRCDVHKKKSHRLKSAFLHQCDFLSVPCFGRLTGGEVGMSASGHFKGPDLVTGEGMHLITETWAVRWTVNVDDRLIELSDRGSTVALAAEVMLMDELRRVDGDAASTSRLLLRAAQMLLVDVMDPLLDAVEAAIVVDWRFDRLGRALLDFIVLFTYRDALATQGDVRLLTTILSLYNRAVMAVPRLAAVPDEEVGVNLDVLQGLVRAALTFGAVDLDRETLAEKLHELVGASSCNPKVRGAAYGVLFSLGATRQKVVARELSGYLGGTTERVLEAGPFLEGLFMTARSIVMGNHRLLATIDQVLVEVDRETFEVMLPDLRRAFTWFIPSEIDDLARQVAAGRGGAPRPSHAEAPISGELRQVGRIIDERLGAAIDASLGGRT